jgi:thiol:disulfide interchange protein DsbD
LWGQIEKSATWKTEVKYPEKGKAEIFFYASPIAKWHFYSLKDELNPMLFTFTKSADYSTSGNIIEVSKAKKEYDDLMEANRHFYEKKATYKQVIKFNTEKTFNVKVTAEYQSCLEDDKCIMEEEDLTIPVNPALFTEVKTDTVKVTDTVVVLEIDTVKEVVLQDTSTAKQNITAVDETSTEDDGLFWMFIMAFVGGLMAILTPCVFPMIPMTVSFFMHNSANKRKARFEAIVYGTSIIAIYTIIGTIVAVTLGANFANFLSTHWIPNVLFFLIFVFFAFSFFGMFEITLPSWMISRSDQKAEKGGVTGAFFMAFTLVLVSFSCTGPIVGAILVKSAGGAILEPIVGMLGFSLAFAIPFTVFAFFPSLLNRLPKSGGWLNAVKVVLGFLELALGLKFLSIADQTYHWGILDREVYLSIWIVIFALMGFYLLGKLKFAHDSDVKHIGVPRLMLSIITFAFVVYMIPGLWGAPLKVLSGYMPPQNSLDFDMSKIVRENAGTSGNNHPVSNLCETPKYGEFLHLPHGLEGYFDLEQGLACAKKLNKPIFIDFTGHGCVNCREMEANVWSDPKVLQKLKNDFIIIALYVDDKTELPENEWITSTYDQKVKTSIGKKFADYQISKYGINAQPYYVLLDTNGEMLVKPHAYNLDVNVFVDFLDRGLKEFEKRKK